MIILIIIVAAVVAFVWYSIKDGNKEQTCASCGKTILEKNVAHHFYNDGKCICWDCNEKVKPYIHSGGDGFLIDYSNWSYEDYLNCVDFAETMKTEIGKFHPDYKYGSLEVDTENLLFTISPILPQETKKVMRFQDILDYSFSFSDMSESKGLVRNTITANEIFQVVLKLPPMCQAEVILKNGVQIESSKKKLFSKTNYDLPEDFEAAMRIFSSCVVASKQVNPAGASVDEMQKALALFMYDDIKEVTKENLKERRNTMIKTFHPDNNESNEAFSQKINNAYDVLNQYL